MQIITTSSTKTYNRCRREYYHSVELGIDAIGEHPALNWGTVWHAGQGAIWNPLSEWSSEFALAGAHRCEKWGSLDEVDQIDIEVLLCGYVEYWPWDNQTIKRIAVEKQYGCPLVNPDTGRQSQIWEQNGVLDGFIEYHDRPLILEHKSSSIDISAGSPYWERLKIDAQCSNYVAGARSLGFDPQGILYDVVKKPRLERLMATPIEKRKYTKETKTEPSRLYAGQREFDETLDEYRQRLIADVSERPEFYFARGEIVRLQSEELEAARDNWDTAHLIHQSQLRKRWPRNTDACERFGRFCHYWPVCTGSADINDTTRYTKTGAHKELNK